MGVIIGLDETIGRLDFTSPKKGKVHTGCDLVILDRADGGTGPDVGLIKLQNGKYFVCGSRHTANGNYAVSGYGLSRFDKSVLGALVKMGAVSEGDIEGHIQKVTARNNETLRRQALEQLQRSCATLGIPNPMATAAE